MSTPQNRRYTDRAERRIRLYRTPAGHPRLSEIMPTEERSALIYAAVNRHGLLRLAGRAFRTPALYRKYAARAVGASGAKLLGLRFPN